jgi:HPt (histidine-containing phosphotransfer) domain-containing protein
MELDLPKEVIQRYLQRRLNDVDTLKKSLSENSVQEFNRIGHQLVGNATSFGFDELIPIAAQMEDLTPEKLATEGDSLILQFKNWLQSAQNKIGAITSQEDEA